MAHADDHTYGRRLDGSNCTRHKWRAGTWRVLAQTDHAPVQADQPCDEHHETYWTAGNRRVAQITREAHDRRVRHSCCTGQGCDQCGGPYYPAVPHRLAPGDHALLGQVDYDCRTRVPGSRPRGLSVAVLAVHERNADEQVGDQAGVQEL